MLAIVAFAATRHSSDVGRAGGSDFCVELAVGSLNTFVATSDSGWTTYRIDLGTVPTN